MGVRHVTVLSRTVEGILRSCGPSNPKPVGSWAIQPKLVGSGAIQPKPVGSGAIQTKTGWQLGHPILNRLAVGPSNHFRKWFGSWAIWAVGPSNQSRWQLGRQNQNWLAVGPPNPKPVGSGAICSPRAPSPFFGHGLRRHSREMEEVPVIEEEEAPVIGVARRLFGRVRQEIQGQLLHAGIADSDVQHRVHVGQARGGRRHARSRSIAINVKAEAVRRGDVDGVAIAQESGQLRSAPPPRRRSPSHPPPLLCLVAPLLLL